MQQQLTYTQELHLRNFEHQLKHSTDQEVRDLIIKVYVKYLETQRQLNAALGVR